MKADKSIRIQPGLAIPNHSIWSDRDPIRIRTVPARRPPFFELLRRIIETAQISALVVCVVNGVIGRDRQSAGAGTRVGDRVLGDSQSFGINTRQFVGSEFAKIWNAGASYHNPVRYRMRRRNYFQLDFSGLRIKTSHEVRLFGREPQNSLLIEHRSVRICFPSLGHVVFGYVASVRVQLSDISLANCCEPDIALGVGNKTMRSGVGSFQRKFLYLPGCRNESPQLIGLLPRVPK